MKNEKFLVLFLSENMISKFKRMKTGNVYAEMSN